MFLVTFALAACGDEGAPSPTTLPSEVATEPSDPSGTPTATITAEATAQPSGEPTVEPTAKPTAEPTPVATVTADPESVVLGWTRSGGIAGFCDGLLLTAGHMVTLGTCEDPGAGAADADFAPDEAIREFAEWREQYQSFEVEWADGPEIADGMTVRLSFVGRGSAVADEEVRLAIAEFASRLFFEVSSARPRA
jgi:hypothetical protein